MMEPQGTLDGGGSSRRGRAHGPRPRIFASGTGCAALALALVAAPCAAQGTPPPAAEPTHDASRMAGFLREAARPMTWAEPLGYTVLDQARDKPDDWDSDADGFGRRAASHAGRTAISLSVRHGVAALLERPAGPVRCPGAPRKARLAEAALEPVADCGCDGGVRVAVPRIAARVASGFAPLAWHQPDYSAAHAARGIASGFVSSALIGVAKVLVFGK